MRYTVGILLIAALCVPSFIGCGPAKPGAKSGGGSTEVITGKGEIVKPPVIPEVPPSPEEAALAKLGTAELLEELGKPHAREVASKILSAKGESAVPDLVRALKHENWQVRAGAVFTLSRLGKAAAEALPELKKLQETETNETVKDSIPYCVDAIEGK